MERSCRDLEHQALSRADTHGARGAAQTQVIINCGALPCLLNLLQTSHKKSIKKEACWTISNITAGTKDQIQAVIDSHILPPLVQVRRSYACTGAGASKSRHFLNPGIWTIAQLPLWANAAIFEAKQFFT